MTKKIDFRKRSDSPAVLLAFGRRRSVGETIRKRIRPLQAA
jgi:hypothetical protein